jgi:hypothetical protein
MSLLIGRQALATIGGLSPSVGPTDSTSGRWMMPPIRIASTARLLPATVLLRLLLHALLGVVMMVVPTDSAGGGDVLSQRPNAGLSKEFLPYESTSRHSQLGAREFSPSRINLAP